MPPLPSLPPFYSPLGREARQPLVDPPLGHVSYTCRPRTQCSTTRYKPPACLAQYPWYPVPAAASGQKRARTIRWRCASNPFLALATFVSPRMSSSPKTRPSSAALLHLSIHLHNIQAHPFPIMKRRRPSPLATPLLLLALLLPSLRAQPEHIDLTDDDPTIARLLNLNFNSTQVYTVAFSDAGHVRAEFLSNQPMEDLVDHGRTYIFLAAADSGKDSLIFTDGFASDVRAEFNKETDGFECSRSTPCFLKDDRVAIDAQAVYTHATRAVVSLPVTKDAQISVTVRNLDRGVLFGEQPRMLQPRLRGWVRLSFAKAEDQLPCPGFTLREEGEEGIKKGTWCSGNGRCGTGKCNCKEEYRGLACGTQVESFEDLRDGDGNVALELEPFARKVISWTQKEEESRVQIILRTEEGSMDERNEEKTRFNMAYKVPEENNSPYLENASELPSEYELKSNLCGSFKQEKGKPPSYACVRNAPLKKDAMFVIGFITEAIGTEEKSPSKVKFKFRVERCGIEGNQCLRIVSEDQLNFPLVIVLVCGATICFTAIAIAVMLWLDRQHGFTNSVDRLSVKELDRMYPSHRFRTAPRAPTDSVAEDDCLICLSRFQENDVVRQLECEHIYHSECLDPWVTQNNASCPACRCDVRIQSLSDRRRLRRVVTFFLFPIVWVRNLRVRQSGEAISADTGSASPPDLESGPETPVSSEPERLRRHAREGGETGEVEQLEEVIQRLPGGT
ncbi:unnamed protein product [Chondrus crispus]|uniref:RING-type domain-containing protein n=1 Tax=Chondrus crispus TaxID=2769 RepID=R7Q803_CHOCR|nr:unnamed protein product [Chondrus crispus]CDF33605.1 unnamed protein product [Chondrus crispus]|eukprot:XP_005713408.1 unnamed protein product [Chondrus crispus]